MNTLYRSKTNKVLGGVCGGVAEALDVNATALRLITFLAALFFWFPFFVYLAAWLIMKVKPD